MLPSDLFSFTGNAKPIPAISEAELAGTGGLSGLSTIVKTSEVHTISLRSAFNAAAPCNRLPTELVVKILASGAWGFWWELVALTHICQHWRNVAVGTPELWANAVRFTLASMDVPLFQHLWGAQSRRILPTFLARSASCPLRVELPSALCLASLDAILNPHFSRLAHLSIQVKNAHDFAEVLHVVHPHMRNIETLHVTQVDRPWGSPPISIDELPSWEDTDFPHLRTLTIPGHCFTPAVAVASLKALVLSDGPRNHDIFLAALNRCSLALESLTLHRWAHLSGATDGSASSTRDRIVRLPNLRQLEIALHHEHRNARRPPVLLFAGLSLPASVAIKIDWHCMAGNIGQLVPKHVVGLHAAPFFDSMCLHLSGPPQTASVHCYVDAAERLCARERPNLDLQHHEGRSFAQFLDEHRYPTVTQLAIDIDVDPRDKYTPLVQGELLRRFVNALPNLRRLDLLGKTVGNAKLAMAEAFLTAAPSIGALREKTLGYVCEVPEMDKRLNTVGFVDVLRAQLDVLEALLTTHLADSSSDTEGGPPRLHRLELCITYCSPEPHPPPQAYPYVHEVAPSADLTTYLSSIYLPRLGRLVDEVVFIGHVKRRGVGYRVLTGAERHQVGPKHQGRLAGGMPSRSARKGW